MNSCTGSSSRTEPIGCVILASGLGRRFGGNKLMAPFRGRPLVAWALDATGGIFDRRVVITRHRDVAQLCRSRGVEALLHNLPDRSDTVRLGLEAVGDVKGCLFCPGDQPLLSRETVEALVRLWESDRDALCRPIWEDCPGAPVLFPAWTFPELASLPRGAGGGYVIRRYPGRVRYLPVSREQLLDADTPQALSVLEKL